MCFNFCLCLRVDVMWLAVSTSCSLEFPEMMDCNLALWATINPFSFMLVFILVWFGLVLLRVFYHNDKKKVKRSLSQKSLRISRTRCGRHSLHSVMAVFPGSYSTESWSSRLKCELQAPFQNDQIRTSDIIYGIRSICMLWDRVWNWHFGVQTYLLLLNTFPSFSNCKGLIWPSIILKLQCKTWWGVSVY